MICILLGALAGVLFKKFGNLPYKFVWSRLEENIIVEIMEVGYDDVGWIKLAQNTDQWEVPANKVMKLRVPQKAAMFTSDEGLLVSRDVFCGMERLS
jgi:hypothetical protein